MRQSIAAVFILTTPWFLNVASSQESIPEITVTAQKREQPANTVGMSITAVSVDTLDERGITSLAELTRLVPGFTVQQSSFNSTSFTLRGVGFFNSDLATPPAVSVYVDEAPLPYPAMTKLVAFDLARVEVLKGPQGTLYGQNATGGAVNYIAAAPTESVESGMNATYGRFNRTAASRPNSSPLRRQCPPWPCRGLPRTRSKKSHGPPTGHAFDRTTTLPSPTAATRRSFTRPGETTSR